MNLSDPPIGGEPAEILPASRRKNSRPAGPGGSGAWRRGGYGGGGTPLGSSASAVFQILLLGLLPRSLDNRLADDVPYWCYGP